MSVYQYYCNIAGLTQVYLSRQWDGFPIGLVLVVEDGPTELS